ncbi:hypothetical protein Tco_1569136 [Tanacetum coccineum]
MHTRASNSELVEPIAETERTLNRRLRRQNRRVMFERRNKQPEHPRVIYPTVLAINHFRHFLILLENFNPMEDEPMWTADRVVAPTPGEAINWLDELNEGTIESWDEVRTASFADEGNINSDTNKIMARMDAMAMKMDAQYKEIQSRAKCNHSGGNHSTADCNDDDTPMSREE